MIPIVGSYIELLRKAGAKTADLTAADNAHLKSLQDSFKITTKTVKASEKLSKLSAQQLKDLRLKNALDKANLALNTGADVFDMDAIQINAALISQAEQLGKATSSAQQLAIANDVARLNVKQSMYELEQAIASGDVKAIEAATTRLNEDVKILGALTGQKYTLTQIESLLNGLKPKELIDQENLNLALAKIKQMLDLLGQASTTSKAKIPSSGSLGSGITVGDYIAPISKDVASKGSIGAILEYADAATERANAFALLQEQQNYADYLSLIEFQNKLGDFGGYSSNMNTGRGYGAGSSEVVVTIVDNTSGLIEVVQDAVIQNNRYGNNLTFAGAIPI